MFTDLIINTPGWFVLIVLAIGLLYAGLLYYRNHKNKLGKFLTIMLFITRFIVVTVIAFLLLSPFIKTRTRVLEKPVVVLGIDNSASMINIPDSIAVKTNFTQDLKAVINALESKYEVDTYLFGDNIQLSTEPAFDQGVSNYADFILKVKEDYAGTNFGALVIAGDGIINRGIDPVFAASGTGFPIYTIATGDTSRNRDLKVNDIRYNSIVYLGDDFPLEVNVSAMQMEGENATLKIFAFGRQQALKRFKINSSDFNRTFNVMINAPVAGKQRMQIRLETNGEEVNSENNRRNVFFDVLDNRQKILILAGAPHPDVAAIKKSIELNINYELEVSYASEFNGKPDDYDLIVLHQLPSVRNPLNTFLNLISEKDIPVLYILGKQSNISAFNRQYNGVDFRIAGRNFEDAQAMINPGFTLFTFDALLAAEIEKFPPLIVHLGNYQVPNSTSVFATQRISSLATDYPLIAFSPIEGIKNGFVAGEGLWMWRLHNYLLLENTVAFDTFVQKMVQLLLLRKDKRFFRVITEGEYAGSRNVIVQAELYNQSYEPVNTTDVSFTLTNENGDTFEYLFSPDDNTYSLDLKRLPVGVYNYLAKTRLGTENYAQQGEFVVSGESLESRMLQADHGLLFRIASQNNGEMLYPDQFESLPAKLAERDNLKTRVYYEEKYTGLFNLWWVIGLVLFLLSLEWFLRKYYGTY